MPPKMQKSAKRIMVINPNSNQAFTDGMNEVVEYLRFDGGPEIHCQTLVNGPLAIETTRDADEVAGPICDLIEKSTSDYDAFVIGCFSDPGVVAAREVTPRPVLGLCEAAVSVALNLTERFGFLTNWPGDENDERRLLRAQGLETRLVGIEAINVSVVDLTADPDVGIKLCDAAVRLRDVGAGCVVLSCSGMAPYARQLQRDAGLWVVDPVTAAVGLAIAAANLSD